MSRSGSRARNRKHTPAPVPDGPLGGRPHFEQFEVAPGQQELRWIPEGPECENIWMAVIVHPTVGVPCLAISLGSTAHALVPIEAAGPLLFNALQGCQVAAQHMQATAAIVGPDGRPLA